MYDSSTASAGTAFAEQLAAMAQKIDFMVRPMENVFVGIGTPLGEAFEVFNALQSQFKQLSERMSSDEARQSEGRIIASVGHCGALVSGLAESAAAVTALADGVSTALPLILSLQKIIDEVGSLAMNAKIQAAQVADAGTDFAVFTAEMGRLHNLAHGTVSDAADRVSGISRSVAGARAAEEEFRRKDGEKLEFVRRRLQAGTTSFGSRRERAHLGMHTIGETFSDVSQQVAQIIRRMQINDITRQRLEHVSSALVLARLLLDGAGAASSTEGQAWVRDLTPERKTGLFAAICHLQSKQLSQAVEVFAQEIDLLQQDMLKLCDGAEKTAEEAVRSFGGVGKEDSFLSDLQRDVDDSVAALNAYATSYQRVLAIVENVDQEFASLGGNMREIHSIDADMRIMGLNATLKCGRLGSKGRALGVVAQELRACSRRTEEFSSSITRLIEGAKGSASRLRGQVTDGFSQVTAIEDALSRSMTSFNDLDEALKSLMAEAKRQCAMISARLRQASELIILHREMRSAAGAICQELDGLVAALPGAPGFSEQASPADEEIQRDLRRLLEGHYTMTSERVTHGIVASGAGEAESKEADSDLDEIFF